MFISMVNKRIFIEPKDLMVLTGKSYNTCRRYLSLVKDTLSKNKNQKVTINEYANYEGIDPETISSLLQ